MMLLGHLSAEAHVHGFDVVAMTVLCGIVLASYAALKLSK